jgi:CBS domain-containing membrane protein
MVRKLAYSVSEREHWISATGGLIGILSVWLISYHLLGSHAAALVATSMGSTAVMLFAAPHGPMSQPWPLVGGHTVSAVIGVTCVHWLGSDLMLASALAVGLSIAAMYSLRCLHPPGGATALGAVLGGETVHALGYGFVFTPILLNSLVILAVAVAYNYPFAWRRYPQAWAKRPEAVDEKSMIPHSRLVYALSQLDTFVDISEEDLQRIYDLAMHDEAATLQQAGSLATHSTRP